MENEMNITYKEVKKRAPKGRDVWSRKLLTDPIALPLTYLLAKYNVVSSLGLTLLTYAFGVLAALAFGTGNLILGVTLYYTRFLLDAMDGKLARVKQEDDTYRGTIDFLGDGIVDVLVVVGLAIQGDKTLLFLLLAWLGICFLIHRSTSLSYRLLQAKGISSKNFVSPEMEEIYGHNRLIEWYHKLAYKAEKHGTNAIPSAAESVVLMYIVGPLLWSFTNNIQWMHFFVSLGVLLSLPVTLGTGVIAYQLSRKETK